MTKKLKKDLSKSSSSGATSASQCQSICDVPDALLELEAALCEALESDDLQKIKLQMQQAIECFLSPAIVAVAAGVEQISRLENAA